MSTKLRFAPSPTGKLHVGNTRTALINWLFCKKTNGSFMLRMDDTDQERSKDIYRKAIEEDLSWLGLNWDVFMKQSDRQTLYHETADKLKNLGRLYPCYETPEELDLKRKVQLSKGQPPIYDRESLNLTKQQISDFEKDGRKPHWRFKLDNNKNIHWKDLVRGPVDFETKKLSDPVLIRADGTPLFTLTTVVDDLETEMTHIFRGEDHVANTAIQIQIFEALGKHLPEFGHFPLLTDHKGYGLSKRIGSLGISDLKEQGILPISLIGFLAHLGTNTADDGYSSLEEIASIFDVKAFGRAAPKFDPKELEKVNEKRIQHISYQEIRDKIESLIPQNPEVCIEKLWHVVQTNIKKIEDIMYWYKVCADPNIQFYNDNIEYLNTAKDLLPDTPWNEETWGKWIQNIKEKTGKKGKDLFMPLRMALTGKTEGPEIKKLLPLINRSVALRRLGI